MARRTNQGSGEQAKPRKGEVSDGLTDQATEGAEANRAHTGGDFTNYPEAAESHDPSPTERTGGEPRT